MAKNEHKNGNYEHFKEKIRQPSVKKNSFLSDFGQRFSF